MRSHTRPKPPHEYSAAAEIAALRQYRDTEPGRAIPVPQGRQRLVATWNIANLGQHKRRAADHEVIAELISWFDLVAIQEVADDLSGLESVVNLLPARYSFVVNDKAGNNERAAYIYDTTRFELGHKIGEIVIVESDRDAIKLPGVNSEFGGFNRNPYLASFKADDATLLLANAHLFYGKTRTAEERTAGMEQRQLEAFAIGRWCRLRRRSRNAYTKHIFAIGDFNLPQAAPGDPIFDALTRQGLMVPPHDTRVPGTNLAGDKDYDQIAFVPGLKDSIVEYNSFDFDGAVFHDLWEQSRGRWRTCVKYYLSDHRPLWALVELPAAN